MVCPKCGLEARISSSRYVVKNDDTAEKPTELYIEQTMVCRNDKCTEYEKEIGTVTNPIEL